MNAVEFMKNLVAEAHMQGQSHAGCKHPSWGEAYAHATSVVLGEKEDKKRVKCPVCGSSFLWSLPPRGVLRKCGECEHEWKI